MAGLPILLMVAGTALKATAELKEGKDISEAELFNASVALSQAAAVKEAGRFERATIEESGKVEQRRIARAKKQTIGAQRAGFAASGVRLRGSPIEVIADTATQFELDLAASRYNTQLGLRQSQFAQDVDVSFLTSQAERSRRRAKSARTASFFKAGSTIATGLSQAGAFTPATTTTSIGSGVGTRRGGGLVRLT